MGELSPPETMLTDVDLDKVDLEFWLPYFDELVSRHGLPESIPRLGRFASVPVLIAKTYVVKLFGLVDGWQDDYETELAALRILSDHRDVAAPLIIAEGRLFDRDPIWPYIVMSRISGTAWQDKLPEPHPAERIAAELGRVMKEVHALPILPGAAAGRLSRNWLRDHGSGASCRHREWDTLPPHLVDQIDEYVVVPSGHVCLTHADLASDHVFIENDAIAGIIDWGGAEATDPFYELVVLHVDAFAGDRRLLAKFLEGYQWSWRSDFCRRAMSAALMHESNAFENLLFARPGLSFASFETLDQLATHLWDV